MSLRETSVGETSRRTDTLIYRDIFRLSVGAMIDLDWPICDARGVDEQNVRCKLAEGKLDEGVSGGSIPTILGDVAPWGIPPQTRA